MARRQCYGARISKPEIWRGMQCSTEDALTAARAWLVWVGSSKLASPMLSML